MGDRGHDGVGTQDGVGLRPAERDDLRSRVQKYVITFPAGEFARFPGIGITGWGINGAVPVVNLASATKEKNGSFKYVVYVSSTAGPLNLHDNGFAFVATEVSK
jgi:hypothetical protein